MRKRTALLLALIAVSLLLLYKGREYYPPLNEFFTNIETPITNFKNQAISFLKSELGGTLSLTSIFAVISGKLGSLWKAWKYKPIIQDQEVRHHNKLEELRQERDYWKRLSDNDVPHLVELIEQDEDIMLEMGREIEANQQRFLEEKEALNKAKEGLEETIRKRDGEIERLENEVDNLNTILKEKRGGK